MTHRKHSHAFGTITLTVTACLLLWGFQLPAWAGDATQIEPLALRKIMQELGRNMQAITGCDFAGGMGSGRSARPKSCCTPRATAY